MKHFEACRGCRMVLEEESVTFGGMLLRYQLLVCNGGASRFLVRVSLGEEHTEAELGGRMETALSLYHTLVRGRVTPCGLSEVMADLCG